MAALTKQGKSTYQIMMREVSNNIQDLAMAYGERNTLEQCLVLISKLKNAENVKVMTIVYRLFAVDTIKQNLGFYLVNKAVGREAASALTGTQHQLVKDVAANVVGLMNSLNVPLDQLYVPIAQDYEKYYSAPNYGEIVGARM